jgi:uncharacterized protein (DUF2164 family)
MALELDKEQRSAAIASLQRYLETEMDESVGNIAAGALLGFFLEEIAPLVYNQAIADAQEKMQARVQDLDLELHEEPLHYWSRKTGSSAPRK